MGANEPKSIKWQIKSSKVMADSIFVYSLLSFLPITMIVASHFILPRLFNMAPLVFFSFPFLQVTIWEQHQLYNIYHFPCAFISIFIYAVSFRVLYFSRIFPAIDLYWSSWRKYFISFWFSNLLTMCVPGEEYPWSAFLLH